MRFLGLILLLTWTHGTSRTLRAAEATWKTGVARVVITPEKEVWLAGYGSKRQGETLEYGGYRMRVFLNKHSK